MGSVRQRLALCLHCGEDAVAVVDAVACGGADRWEVTLRCGACERRRLVVASESEMHAFCDELAWFAILIEADAEYLWRERTAVEIEIFVAALELDLIGTDDFFGAGSRRR